MRHLICSVLFLLGAGCCSAQYPSMVLARGDGWKIVQVKPYVNPFSVGGNMYRGAQSGYGYNRNSSSTGGNYSSSGNRSNQSAPAVPVRPREIPVYETYWKTTRAYLVAKDYDSCLARINRSKYWEGSVLGNVVSSEWIQDYASLHLACLYYLERYKDAIAVYETMPAVKRHLLAQEKLTVGSAPYYLGLCLFEEDRTPEAIKLWEGYKNVSAALVAGQTRAFGIGGDEVRILLNLGIFNYGLQDYLNASNSIATALYAAKTPVGGSGSLDNNKYYPYYKALQGHSLIETFNAAEGLKLLEGNTFDGFSEDEKFEIVSKGYLFAGRYDECEQYCRAAFSNPKTALLASLRLAECYLYQNKWKEAEKVCQPLLVEDPTNLYALYRKAFADIMQGKAFDVRAYDKTISVATAAGKGTGKNLNICESVKILYYVKSGQLQPARDLLNKRIKSKGQFRDPLEFYAVGQLLKADGRDDLSKNFMNYAISANMNAAKDYLSEQPGGYNADANVATKLNSITEALRNKDIPALKKFIALGQANQEMGDGLRPLHIACQMANEEMIDLLLKAGANPNATATAELLPVFFFLDYAYYIKTDKKCLQGVFTLLRNAGMKVAPEMAERYILMNRESLVDRYNRKYYSKDARNCEEGIKKILESCK